MKNIANNTDQSRTEISGSYRTPDGKAQIDFGITYRNGYPEYTSSGHFDGSSDQCLDAILAAYPDNEHVKSLYKWWTAHHLESVADAQKGVTTATAYDVLACISGDAYTPETFADFCAEYGYESDSIKALQQFRRCDRFAKRLRAFFTTEELTQLSEIR